MASWIDAVKAKKSKGAGSVHVNFAGSKLTIDLRYPTASARIRVGELTDKFRKKYKDSDEDAVTGRIEYSDALELLVVKECLPPDTEIGDDELIILIRETGGTDSPLVQRCAKLVGVEAFVGGSDDGGDTKPPR